MSDRLKFEGQVVRVEADGFGVVKFDQKIGANTHGVFSTDLSTFTTPIEKLRQGMHVVGTAEVDDKEIAAIRVMSASSM
jgi:hypothetical protein